MPTENPFQSPAAIAYADPAMRELHEGVESILAVRGLLQRKVVVRKPVEVTIEYFARGIRDRIIVDGKTAVSIVPILNFKTRFDFQIPYRGGKLPASVRVKIGKYLRLASFEIWIDDQVVYREENGKTKLGATAFAGNAS